MNPPRLVGLFRWTPEGEDKAGLERTETHAVDSNGRIWSLQRQWGDVAGPGTWTAGPWRWALIAAAAFFEPELA